MGDEGELRLIPLADVVCHKNVRTIIPEPAVQELAQTIRTHGLIHRPVFRWLPGGGMELICGSLRFNAYKHLAEKYPSETVWQSLPVDVRSIPDEAVPTIQLIENDQRQELTPLEIAEHVAIMKNHLSWTEKAIADKFRWKSTRIVRYYITIAEGPAWLKVFGAPTQHQVPKLAADGSQMKDDSGRKLTTTVEAKPLGMSMLSELIQCHTTLSKYDKAQRAINPEHELIAQKVTERIAKKASLGAWSGEKLKAAVDSEIKKITGEGSSPDAQQKPPTIVTGKKKLTIDATALSEPLPKARLIEMKADIVSVLTAIGYKDVILGLNE
jgi:ParB family chromosome partitioning protein